MLIESYTVRAVNVPASAEVPPIITESRVVVVIERLDAVPAALISHVFELIVTASPLSPIVTIPFNAVVPSTVKSPIKVEFNSTLRVSVYIVPDAKISCHALSY